MKTHLIISLILYSICYGADNVDVVHLKNGDVIKGEIIENVINEYIKVEMQGGSILTFPYSDIEKISKETVQKKGNKQKTTSKSSQFNTQQMMMYQIQKKSEGTAMLFSFIIPTAGHAYAGNWGRGLGFAATEVGLYIMALTVGITENCYTMGYSYSYEYCDYEPNGLFWIGFLGAIGTRFLEIFDAGKEAKKYNQNLLMQYGMNPALSMNIVPQKGGASLMLAYNF